MIGSYPLLQVDRVIKELRLALLLSRHDRNISYHFPATWVLFSLPSADLGNTPFRFDSVFPFKLLTLEGAFTAPANALK